MSKPRWILVLALLGACASTDTPTDGGPADRSPIPDGQGRLILYRKSAMKSGAIRPSVMLNGKAIGQSVPGTYFVVDREPGDYTVSCSVATDHSISFSLKEGQTIYIEQRATMGIYVGHIKPGIVSESTGKAAVSKCTRAGRG